MSLVIRGRLVLPGGAADDGWILVRGERIAEIALRREMPGHWRTERAARGSGKPASDDAVLRADWVAPGFIDMHVHGREGHDTLSVGGEAGSRPGVAPLDRISLALARHGVTSWLPTLETSSAGTRDAFLRTVGEAISRAPAGGDGGGAVGRAPLRAPSDPPPGGRAERVVVGARGPGGPRAMASVLGAHLEGPFLNPARAGAQRSRFMMAPDRAVAAAWPPWVRVVTLAPELDRDLAVTRLLARAGVRVGIGHSDASAATVREALAAGATHFTHLYNAMRPLHHREPGVVGAALMSGAFLELIADGHHVDSELCAFTYRAAGWRRIVLVSDSVREAGLPAGTYPRQPAGGGATDAVAEGEVVVSDGETLRLPDGTLYGSAIALDEAVRNMRTWTGDDPERVLACAAENPARLLGLRDRGVLAPGARADLVLLDSDLRLQQVVVGGEPL